MTTTASMRKPLAKSGTSFKWQINCYDGCEHGCHYCYARKRGLYKVIPYSDWIAATPRLDTPDLLRKQLTGMRQATRDCIKDIFICSACDAYQPQDRNHKITRQVIEALIEYELPFTVLTKSPLVRRDIDLFQGYDRCRVGLTIMTLDDDFRKQLEPNAPPITERCDALETLKSAGISTYCSVEPIMSDGRSDPIEIVNQLKDYVDLFEFGKWNPKFAKGIPVRYDEQWYVDTFRKLNWYCNSLGVGYCHAGHSQAFLNNHNLKFIPYPTVLK